jgi:hypothetical protein
LVFVFVLVLFNTLLDVIEVVQEIVFTIILKIICWSIDLPVISQSFSSLVKFNELLKLKVSATKSIFEPIYALSLNDETNDHSTELHSHEFSISISSVHVDTSDESPEACVGEESNGVLVRLTLLV